MILPGATLKRIAGGVGFALVGSGAVFGLMLLMNGLSGPPEKPDFEEKASFQVQSEPKPPPQKKSAPKPKPKPKSSRQKAAPPPQLGSAIGTAGFKMPGFSPGNVDEASEELVGDVEASVMTADSVDKRPEPMRRVDPKLPRRIVAKQLEGKVVVKALIDKEGRVERARIKSAEPKGVFESHVLEAVKQWQFQPATYQGKAVKTWIELPFNFKLG